MRQSVQLPPLWYSSPGLHMQLLWVAEPSSAVLPFGQAMHASEVSEKLSLKVSSGHFVQFAPVPVLSCSLAWKRSTNSCKLSRIAHTHTSFSAWAPARHTGAKPFWCELLWRDLQGCVLEVVASMDCRAVQQLFNKHVRCVRLRSTQSPDCCGSSFSLKTASLCHCPAAQ